MQTAQTERVRLTPGQLETAIAYWEELADAEAKRVEHGGTELEVNNMRALLDIYRRTAESFRIEQRTGVEVCVCCHLPLAADGSHPLRSSGA